MKIILIGAPGSGKGTQAEFLSKELCIPSISTGNILREAIRAATDIGLCAKRYTDNGCLVPDDIMLDIVRQRLSQPDCRDGYILDGFPRTITQAQALEDAGIVFDAVLSLEVPDEEIEQRMSGRRVCEECGASYHLDYCPPKREQVCDACGGIVCQRTDDAPETVRKRLKVYYEMTEPVIGFYQKRGRLRMVAAHDDIDAVGARIIEIMGLPAAKGLNTSACENTAHD